MSHEQKGPETIGVTVTLLKTVDLGPEIEGMEGRPGRAWAGRRTETPCTGWRTGEACQRWRSPSI